jgi:hypothetical protein
MPAPGIEELGGELLSLVSARRIASSISLSAVSIGRSDLASVLKPKRRVRK